MSIDMLLSRLQKVKSTARDSWLACCPAHDDKTPSLSIRDLGDGRILINCFAGCETEHILESIGMTWDDVLPDNPTHHRAKPVQTRIYSTDALRIISFEARIVMIAAFDMEKGNLLSEEDRMRLKLAYDRIDTALGLANVN